MTVDRTKPHQTCFDDVVLAGKERDSLISPGEVLHEELMEPLGLSAAALSRVLHVPANRITALVNGQRGLTADTALRLARYFETTPELRVRLQAEYDLRQARRSVAEEIKREISLRVA